MRISVTQEDIDHGTSYVRDCMVARAIGRALSKAGRVSVGLWTADVDGTLYRLGEPAPGCIDRWIDDKSSVRPFEFEMERM